MHIEFSYGMLLGFLLVLARVAGVFIFVPLPGLRPGADLPRAVMAIGATLALWSRWPPVAEPGIVRMAGWLLSEAALGIAAGLATAVATEAFQFAAQVAGMQAGFGYASTIDPSTEADSGVLLVIAQLTAGMLFFALGFDREVLRIFARSLETIPPGAFAAGNGTAEAVSRMAAGIFTTGFRLALPVTGILLLVDIALALMSRINAQLQLLTLAFPVKMLAALALLAWIAALFPRVYRGATTDALGTLRAVLGM